MKTRQMDDRNQTPDYMKFDEIIVPIDDQCGDRLVVLQTGVWNRRWPATGNGRVGNCQSSVLQDNNLCKAVKACRLENYWRKYGNRP